MMHPRASCSRAHVVAQRGDSMPPCGRSAPNSVWRGRTPHDLRRTHGSTITALAFGRDAMNRILNHREGGIASVYDRHGYAEETKRVMEAVAGKIMAQAEGRSTGGKVVQKR